LAAADPAATKRSDLPVRIASAAVMVTVAGGAFWLGGWFLTAFIAVIGLGIFAEWVMLVLAFERRIMARVRWLVSGVVYIGLGCQSALVLKSGSPGLLDVVASVIAVDIGAYFAGRTFGGPKIAPAISPSKTWSGLGGAILAVTAYLLARTWMAESAIDPQARLEAVHEGLGLGFDLLMALLTGPLIAIVAQSGDFFESWMKRRAGVKDSGRLIPGHGGLFDRADGLIAVLFVLGLIRIIPAIVGR